MKIEEIVELVESMEEYSNHNNDVVCDLMKEGVKALHYLLIKNECAEQNRKQLFNKIIEDINWKDAERYRFLRNNTDTLSPSIAQVMPPHAFVWLSGNYADETIDKWIKKEFGET